MLHISSSSSYCVYIKILNSLLNFTPFYLCACTHYLIFIIFLYILPIPVSMADACAATCSSSSMAGSASTSYSQYYDVFINHRGPDVKDTFATPLYWRLTSSRLQVFLDKPEMQPGQDIRSQIEAAIQVAHVHIAIFSPRYAESKWCLNELLLMVKSGKPIIPVFYEVKPEDLRRTGGDSDEPYTKALQKHEQKRRHDIQTIEEWRKALSHAANISGFVLEAFYGNKEELLDKVVQSVLKLVSPQLDVAKYPTGLEKKLEEFERTVLSQHEGELQVKVKVVGIVGLGGVGKTTLAKYFFNRKRSNYKESSFLFDVRENTTRGNLNSLQCKLINDLKHRDIKIDRVEEGIEILKNNLSSCHALVILDDIDHIDQLDAFSPIKDVLHPNSLILVTSRDNGVLRRASMSESSIYHLGGLNGPHSRQLFCSHAFSRPDPLPGFEFFVEGFIKTCDGLPLSLKVLGALLCGQNGISYWEELLDGLTKLPDEIENRLRISYDSLNEEEKQIFLDIACFCVGEDRDRWIRIWGGSGWKGLVGFQNLHSKCLVDLDSENKIGMHDHLRGMGRNIADSSISMPRRLWQPMNNLQEINDVLDQSSSSVITEVRGIRMPRPYNRTSSSHEVCGMRKLQLLEAQGNFVESILTRVQSPKLIWLSWCNCPCSTLPDWIPMHDLRVLEVESKALRGLWEFKYQAPLKLRELIIYAPLVEFPKSLGLLKHLEKIVARKTSLATFLDKFNLPSLKYLELHGCQFNRLWQCRSQGPLQLRELIIDAPLVEFPRSLGQLKYLEKIVAKNTHLASFPEEFNLPSLKYLRLNGCQFKRLWQCGSQGPLQLRALIIDAPLVEFPRSLGQLKHLEKIVARNVHLATFPEEFNLPALKYLELHGCQFQRLWQSGSQGPLQLQELIVDAPLVEFPKSLGKLKYLQRVVARKTPLAAFPEDLNHHSSIDLKLEGCNFRRLWEFQPGGPLRSELIIDAPFVEFPKSLGQVKDLEKIIARKTSLATFPEEFNLSSLKYLELHGCQFQRLWQCGSQEPLQLRKLIIDAPLIEFPRSLGQLKHLEKILAKNTHLATFPEEFNLPSLKYLKLDGCQFQRLWQSEFHAPLQLQKLIIDAPLVEFPRSLGQLKHLEKIVAKNIHLATFPEEFNLPTLKYLVLDGCQFQRLWRSESEGPLQLEELIIDAPLVEFPKSLGQLKRLQKVVARRTPLAAFPEELNQCSPINLKLDGCKFRRWQFQSGGPLLSELIIDAPVVEFPKSLGHVKDLEKIVARKTSLTSFPEEFNLLSLKYLELHGCQFQRLWQCRSDVPLQLRELIIDAPLVEFPKSLGQLKYLEKIVATNTSLATDFCYLPSLKYLNLKDFELMILPDFEGKLTKLSDSYLPEGHSMLRGSLSNLANLLRIKLYNCSSLEMLLNFLWNLSNLQHIDLAGCKGLKELPNSLGNLTNLHGIILKECESLKVLPNSFGNLTNLQHIDLYQCQSLKMLPNSFGNLTNLQSINLSCCQSLERIPNSFGYLTNLRSIELSFCKSLEILPYSLGNLWQLKHLSLKGCCLTISSETLGNLTKLKCLDLSCCLQMELLPPHIGHKMSLERLNLLGTNLKEFPCDLVSLSNLEVLRVGSPLLEVLPFSLGCLANLKKLWLHECEKLQCLPDSVELLSHLTELKIWKCGIQYLPPTVMKMENLKVLSVCGCPLRELPFKRLSLELSSVLPLDSSFNKGMFQLQELQLYGTEVSEVSFPEGVCPNLQDLRVVRCEHLVEVGAFPRTLKNLDLKYCGALKKIVGIYGVAKLEKLDMRGCYNIEVEELRGLEALVSSGVELLRSQTEHLEDDSSFEQNVLSGPFCSCWTPFDT